MKLQRYTAILLRVLAVLLVTVLIVLLTAVGAVYIVLCGPSRSASELLTRSLKETSAAGFVPDLFLSGERVAEIMSAQEDAAPAVETDTSLVTIRATRQEPGQAAEEGAADGETDRDIEFVEITGAAYRGIMMVVKDPTRVFVGTLDDWGGVGLSLEQQVKKYDAVGGINGGGFEDLGGNGTGGKPRGIVIVDGELVWGSPETSSCVIGFDGDGILHVGNMTGQSAMNRNLKWACSFGPALIVNGQPMTGRNISSSGVNPRTAIGQRADGAVLLLVVDGRQVTSLGATLEDLVGILMEHGAVNAANLDGGSSSQMIYNDATLNLNSSLIGMRALPTTFLVRRAEGGGQSG